MFARARGRNDYRRLGRTSLDATNSIVLDGQLEVEEDSPSPKFRHHRRPSFLPRNLIRFFFWTPYKLFTTGPAKWKRLFIRGLFYFIVISSVLLLATPIFRPSYSTRPSHYSGSNPRNERVFIAANIVDEDLIRGPWGKALLGLIDAIGPDNVFLSIYENDSGPGVKDALRQLEAKVKCMCPTSADNLLHLLTLEPPQDSHTFSSIRHRLWSY
jgi:hypothetical protein